MLHVPVSLLAFTILFTFYLDQSCAPCTTMHRKNTEVLSQFFSCSYSQLYPCTRPLTSDRRSQVSIWTRVSLLATWHCLDTWSCIRANSNLSLISHSPRDSGPRLCSDKSPMSRNRFAPGVKVTPGWCWLWVSGLRNPHTRPPAADLTSHWPRRPILGCDWSALTPHWPLHFSACAVARSSVSHEESIIQSIIQYYNTRGAVTRSGHLTSEL